MANRKNLTITYKGFEAEPEDAFFESLGESLDSKWVGQGFSTKSKVRDISYHKLTPLQLRTIKAKAKEFLPNPKFKTSA